MILSASLLGGILGIKRANIIANKPIVVGGYGIIYIDVNGGGDGSGLYMLKWGSHEALSQNPGATITDNGDQHTITISSNGSYIYIQV